MRKYNPQFFFWEKTKKNLKLYNYSSSKYLLVLFVFLFICNFCLFVCNFCELID